MCSVQPRMTTSPSTPWRVAPDALFFQPPLGGLHEARQHPFAREFAEDLRSCGGAENDLLRAGVEPLERVANGPDATAEPTAMAPNELTHDLIVGAAPEGGVEIDDGDLADNGEFLGHLEGVGALDRGAFAAHKLDRPASHEIDGWNDHRRTSTPNPASSALRLVTVVWPS